MGYGLESKQGQVLYSTLTPPSLASVADNLVLMRVVDYITVTRIGVAVTTACTTTAFVCDFDKRVTFGSDTGRVDKGVGTMTAPTASIAAGQIVYKDVNVDLAPGDEVSFQITTACTAGVGMPFIEYVPKADVPANDANFTASA